MNRSQLHCLTCSPGYPCLTSASDTRIPHPNASRTEGANYKAALAQELQYSARDQVVSNLRAHLYMQLLLACLTFPHG